MPTALSTETQEYPTVGALWAAEQWWHRVLARRRSRVVWDRPPVVWDPEAGRWEVATVTEAALLAALERLTGEAIPRRTVRWWAEQGVIAASKPARTRGHEWEYDDDAPWQALTYRELIRATAPVRWTAAQVAEARRYAMMAYPSPVDLDGMTIREAGLHLRPDRLPAGHLLSWAVEEVWAPVPGRRAWVPRDMPGGLALRVRIWRALHDRLVAGWPPETPLRVVFRTVGPGLYRLQAEPVEAP